MILRTIIGTTMGFFIGTALHEGTHWIVAVIWDADINHVSVLPPNPHVAYIAPTESVDAWIRAAPIPLSLVFLVIIGLLLRRQDISTQLTLLSLAVGYLPRSSSDWTGLADVLKCSAV